MIASADKRRQAVLISDATSALGAALTDLFAADGYALVLVSREPDQLAARQADIDTRFGVPVVGITADLTDPWVPEEIVAEIQRYRWHINTLVNNAHMDTRGAFIETNLGQDLKMIQTHVGAAIDLTKRVLPAMLRCGSGRILNLGPTTGLIPSSADPVHDATQAFVRRFSEGLARQLKGSGVTVTTLLPGAIRNASADEAALDRNRRSNDAALDVRRVARIGYRALLKGHRRVVVRRPNRVLAATARFMPQRVRDLIGRCSRRSGRVDGSRFGHRTGSICCWSSLWP